MQRWTVKVTTQAADNPPAELTWATATDEIGVIAAVANLMRHAQEEWKIGESDRPLKTLSVSVTPVEV